MLILTLRWPHCHSFFVTVFYVTLYLVFQTLSCLLCAFYLTLSSAQFAQRFQTLSSLLCAFYLALCTVCCACAPRVNEGKDRIDYRTLGWGCFLQGETQEFKEMKEKETKKKQHKTELQNLVFFLKRTIWCIYFPILGCEAQLVSDQADISQYLKRLIWMWFSMGYNVRKWVSSSTSELHI